MIITFSFKTNSLCHQFRAVIVKSE